MPKQYIEKEYILNLFQLLFPEVVSKSLNIELGGLILEQYFKRMKIDIYGRELTKNVPVFFENQITQADQTHFEKIIKIIKTTDTGGIVVWEAQKFNNKDNFLDKVIDIIKKSQKPIDFYAVEINDIVLVALKEILEEVHALQLVKQLRILKYLNEPFTIIEKYEGITGKNKAIPESIRIHDTKLNLDLSTRNGINNFLVREIKAKIAYYPGVYKDRANLSSNNITIGAGSSNYYHIGIGRNNAFVELRFNQKNIKTFEEMYQHKKKLEKNINYQLWFDWKKLIIGVYLHLASKSTKKTLQEIIFILDQFIKNFTDYTFVRQG